MTLHHFSTFKFTSSYGPLNAAFLSPKSIYKFLRALEFNYINLRSFVMRSNRSRSSKNLRILHMTITKITVVSMVIANP